MNHNQFAVLVGRLDAIRRDLKLAEFRRWMDRDFASVGHLMPSTVTAIKEAGFADELLGYGLADEK